MDILLGLARGLGGRRALALLIAAHAIGALLATVSIAQDPEESAAPDQTAPTNPGGPLRTLLPMIPQRAPRGSQGEWLPKRDEAALPQFMETLRGSDAVVQVVVGQGRLITLKQPMPAAGARFIAVGDPTIIDFEVLPNPRMIRILGLRAGVTDLSITTVNDETFTFEVHVTWDLNLLGAQLKQIFPEAEIRLAQLREHLVVEGQARSPAQVQQIVQTIEAYQKSVQTESRTTKTQQALANNPNDEPEDPDAPPAPQAGGDIGGRPDTMSKYATPQVINLLRVPGVQQVMLQVKIAELNRTATREIGADLLYVNPSTGTVVGTNIAGGAISAAGLLGIANANPPTQLSGNGPNTTAFGIFPSSDFQILLRALRRNSLLSILAEPNLVAMSGYKASFLAGGQFPVPVPQTSGGVSNSITVQFKNFGVQLDFVPIVLDDETIRLSVSPEVSSIDFTLGTTLVIGGQPIPGLNTRRTSTTVEIKQGETLAIAGLLNVQIEGQTARIPGLGDLPYIGPMFSNTSQSRVEKELLIMVSPVLVHSMRPEEVPCLPGEEIKDPNDLEFYLLNRIESRTGRDFRSTVRWDDRFRTHQQRKFESQYLQGPSGFSE